MEEDHFYVCIKDCYVFVGVADDIEKGYAYCINIASTEDFDYIIGKIKDEYQF